MKVKIRYAVNGKSHDEEIIDLVIYDKNGKQVAYAYSTIWDDLGVCIIDSRSRTNKTIMVGNPDQNLSDPDCAPWLVD